MCSYLQTSTLQHEQLSIEFYANGIFRSYKMLKYIQMRASYLVPVIIGFSVEQKCETVVFSDLNI